MEHFIIIFISSMALSLQKKTKKQPKRKQKYTKETLSEKASSSHLKNQTSNQ
jgi:hypothetical protein